MIRGLWWAWLGLGMLALGACNLRGYECANHGDCKQGTVCVSGWCKAQELATALPRPPSTHTQYVQLKRCAEGKSRHCKTGKQGECAWGLQACRGGVWQSCETINQPLAEKCNGRDDDCNGKIDDSNACVCTPGEKRPCYTGPANTAGNGICHAGTQICGANRSWSDCFGERHPQAEICDGADNNCDGISDEGCNTCIASRLTRRLGESPFVRRGYTARSGDGKYLAQWWAGPHSVQLWDAQNLQSIRSLETNTQNTHDVTWLRFHPKDHGQLLLLRSGQRNFEWWDANTGAPLKLLPFPTGSHEVKSIAFHPNGKYLGLLDKRGTLFIWEFEAQSWSHIASETKTISRFVFHSQDDALYYQAHQLKRWDIGQRKVEKVLWAPGDPLAMLLLKTQDRLLLWFAGKTLQIHELQSGKKVDSLSARMLTHIRLSPDHKHLFLLDTLGKMRSYHLEHRKMSQPIHTCAFPGSVEVYEGSSSLLASCLDGRLWKWHWPTGQVHHRSNSQFVSHTETIEDLAFRPDGKMLASASQDGTVRLWDLSSRKAPLRLEHKDPVKTVAFSPQGTHVATGGEEQKVRLWDAQSGALLETMEGHQAAIVDLAFSPDGARLASSSVDGRVLLWETSTGRKLQTWQAPPGKLVGLAFLEDGKRLLAGSNDGHIHLWDIQSKALLRHMYAHRSGIVSLQLRDDGLRILSASEDHSVKLWNWKTGDLLHVQSDPKWVSRSVAFRPNSQHIYTALHQDIVVWSGITGGAITRWRAHQGELRRIAFHQDGKRLASAGQDQVIKLWQCAK